MARADSSPGDGPAATGGEPSGVGDVFTRKVGPLPIWGWATVVVGAVFMMRRMSGQASNGSSPAQAVTSAVTGSSQAPVIVNPQASGPQATYTQLPGLSPALSSNLTPNEQLIISAYQRYLGRNPEPAGLQYWDYQLQHGLNAWDFENQVKNSDEAKKRSTLASTASTGAAAGFYNANNAAQQAGLPYLYPYQGQAFLYDPSSNTTQAMPAQQ